MKLPKNVYRKKGSLLYFQKDYPIKLRHLTSKKTFSYSLGLKIGATETEISVARTEALEVYDRELKYILESDPSAFEADEHEQRAREILRKLGLKPGQFSKPIIDNRVGDVTHMTIEGLIPQISDMQMEDMAYKQKYGDYAERQYTPTEHSYLAAYKMLLDADSHKPKTLSGLYQEYRKSELNRKDERSLKRIDKRWDRFINLMPSVFISNTTNDDIHRVLDKYVSLRTGVVKGQSIDRELTSIISCIKWANRKYRYSWNIERPRITLDEIKHKQVLSRAHQILFVKGCMTYKRPEVACVCLLQLQGAMMPSEIKRLSQESIELSGDTPIVVVKGNTKTNTRKRIIPIVLKVDFIREHIDEAIRWLNSTTDTAHSHAIKQLLSDLTCTENTYTGHCFRHTFRVNRESTGADIIHSATIAGWGAKGAGVSEHLLNYGTEGLTHSHVVFALFKTSRKIHNHLLAIK